MDAERSDRIWERLLAGRPVDNLGLGHIEGRIDLRGLIAPQPRVVAAFSTPAADVRATSGGVVLRGMELRRLDLSDAALDGVRVFDSTVEDCVFNDASCRDWRLWGTSIIRSSFRGADLRDSALGGVEGTKRNVYQHVDFSGADLRRTVYKAAAFEDCNFSEAKIKKVDFQSTTFVRCVFAGELNEVLFYRRGFDCEAFPENEMRDIDFRNARLRYVEFRKLDLDKVLFPEGEDHIIIDDYPRTLDRIVTFLRARGEMPARKLAAYLAVLRKWAGNHQQRGVLNRSDMRDIAGEEAESLLRQGMPSLH